jgi:hypothetical protein
MPTTTELSVRIESRPYCILLLDLYWVCGLVNERKSMFIAKITCSFETDRPNRFGDP